MEEIQIYRPVDIILFGFFFTGFFSIFLKRVLEYKQYLLPLSNQRVISLGQEKNTFFFFFQFCWLVIKTNEDEVSLSWSIIF